MVEDPLSKGIYFLLLSVDTIGISTWVLQNIILITSETNPKQPQTKKTKKNTEKSNLIKFDQI